VRERLAAYLNANASDLVMIENVSAGVNAVLRSYRFQAGYAPHGHRTHRHHREPV